MFPTTGLKKSAENSLHGLQNILTQVMLFEVLADVAKLDGHARDLEKAVE